MTRPSPPNASVALTRLDRPQLAAVLAHEAPFQPTVLQKDKLIPGGTKTKGYLIDVFMVLSRQR